MEHFPLKTAKMGSTYQSSLKKGSNIPNARHVHGEGEDDMVDITPGLQQATDTTPTHHGTFQLYEHGGQSSTAADPYSYIAQYFSSSTGMIYKGGNTNLFV